MRASDDILSEVIQHARLFSKRHMSEPGISDTYGYFTRHLAAPLNAKRLASLLKKVQAMCFAENRPLRILDIACGGGLITCAMASLGHRALGLDLSAQEIHLAKMFAAEEKMDGMFLQMDVLGNPHWEKTAEETLGGKPDVIVLAYALHHLPTVESFIERLSEWLPPTAHLLINEENPLSPMFRLKHQVRTWIQKDTASEKHRSFPDWKKLLEAHHFKVAHAPVGLDLVPALSRVKPGLCWSLVFSAERS